MVPQSSRITKLFHFTLKNDLLLKKKIREEHYSLQSQTEHLLPSVLYPSRPQSRLHVNGGHTGTPMVAAVCGGGVVVDDAAVVGGDAAGVGDGAVLIDEDDGGVVVGAAAVVGGDAAVVGDGSVLIEDDDADANGVVASEESS